MKFCPKCGNPLDDAELKFCSKCGNLLESDVEVKEEPLQQYKKKSTKKSSAKFILVVLILVVACVGGYFGYNKYQENQQDKERISEEKALIEQQAKEKQAEKEKEEKAIKEQEENANKKQEGLASKSNVNDTFVFGMLESKKYLPYSTLAGMKLTDAKDKYSLRQVEGREYYKNDVVSEVDINSKGNVKNFSIYFNEPINSEALLANVSTLPFMTWNKEEGYFSETGIISETGNKIQIFYYVDTNTLSVDHALVVTVE